MLQPTPSAAFRNALVSMAAVLASFGLTYWLCMRFSVGPSPAILAVALSMGLARKPEHLTVRAWLVRLVALPCIGLAVAFVGLLFLRAPVLGATLFSVAIAASIWLRNFGERAAAIGRIVAIPFIMILAVPMRIDAGSQALTIMWVAAAGTIAFVVSSAVSSAAIRLRLEPAPPSSLHVAREPREGTLQVATRMALQMLVALVAAFAIGMLLFPQHWPWVVLSAFIVCSGAIGRGDAIHKALLRLTGAVAGTLCASLVALVVFPNPVAYAACVFSVLFLGLWLRQINYVFWAACATLVFALLLGAHGAGGLELFVLRVAGIAVGALCAVAATWFVFPIRTEHVVRRRIADTLHAIRDLLTCSPDDPGHPARVAAVEQHVSRLERVAPPARLHRALFGANDERHLAALIDRLQTLAKETRMPDFNRRRAGAELREMGVLLRNASWRRTADGSGEQAGTDD
jgi:hypothetical protein